MDKRRVECECLEVGVTVNSRADLLIEKKTLGAPARTMGCSHQYGLGYLRWPRRCKRACPLRK